MICCLNSDCHNPSCPDDTKFCFNCGTQLVELRRYRPIKQLGSGGFGKTYLAEDIERFNQPCVIKQFAPQSQGTSALEIATRLFEEEARRLQHLGEHSQIPTLLAYFKQDNRLYLVQQYIKGANLLDEVEFLGVFSEQQIRELLLDLLNVLKWVHQEKVIHRDIKPENIIRRPTDNKLVLIDFGASKQLSGTILSKQGTSIGSFGYVPMEQMDGGEAYPASDLYSLGATCFHLLSGVNPWELWKRQGYGWVNNWRQHLRKSVSQELGCVLDKLLQEDYQQRYQSTEAVLQDLNRQSSPPSSPSVRVPQPYRYQYQPPQHNVNQNPSSSSVRAPQPYQYQPRQHNVNQNPLLLELRGHADFVNSVAISPDGETLVSGSSDQTINIWHLKTGKLKTTLTGHSYRVNSIAISPDGETFVSGSRDNTIKILHLKAGKLQTTLTGHSGYVHSVAISPDGETLVSGSWDKIIKIWHLKKCKLPTILTGHSDWVSSVAISPDGQTLVSGSDDKTIKIWHLKAGKLQTTLTGHSGYVHSVAISPDGETLVSGSWDKTIKIWHLKTGKLKTTLTGHSSSVHSVAISPDGETLVSGSEDKTIKIWHLKTGKLKTTLTGHSSLVNSLAISPDGETLVSGSYDKTIKIWRMPK